MLNLQSEEKYMHAFVLSFLCHMILSYETIKNYIGRLQRLFQTLFNQAMKYCFKLVRKTYTTVARDIGGSILSGSVDFLPTKRLF